MSKTLVYERSPTRRQVRPLIMSAENARAAVGGSDAAAVRGRQLHARSATGDQPAGQPHHGNLFVHRSRPARRGGSSRCRGGVAVTRDAARRPGALDPLGDAEAENGIAKHNRAKVGSAARRRCCTPTGRGRSWTCPSSRSCPPGWTTGTGSGTAAKDIRRRSSRRGCATWCACTCARPSCSCARIPWQPKRTAFSNEGDDLGVPARVFPQWLRCTGCDMLGLLPQFSYTNTHPYRTDLARFEHAKCPGRGGRRARRPGAPRFRPGTCSPAPTATSTSSPTTCGCTAAATARRPSSRS